MGGDKGRTRKGRKNELAATGGGDIGAGAQGTPGVLGRDQQKKPPKVLLREGKVQPGTKAQNLHKAEPV